MRVNELLVLNEELATNYANRFKDQVLDVIVETINDGRCIGHTSNYLKVEFASTEAKKNDIVNVKITTPGYPINQGILVK